MSATRVAYDHFVSQEANFVFAVPAERFRIFEHSDAGDLTLVEAQAGVSAGEFSDRIELRFFAGSSAEDELARRFAEQRARCRALGLHEVNAPTAAPNSGDSIGYLIVPILDEMQSGFLAARPWFGGIIVCVVRLARTPSDAPLVTSAVHAAWTWLRRDRISS